MYNGHQANVTFSVDTSSMNIVDKFTGVWNTSNGYVSHSFNQFIQVDNGTLLGVDHGEGGPTALDVYKRQLSNAVGPLRLKSKYYFNGQMVGWGMQYERSIMTSLLTTPTL